MASASTEGTLDACCLKEYHPLAGTPSGQIIKIGDVNCYHIVGNNEASKGKVIVLLTDVFGLSKNPCMTADEVAEKSGFDVYVPDIFNGDPISSDVLKLAPEAPGEKMSIGNKLRLGGKFLTVGPWLYRHRQAVTLPIIENFLKILRNERGVTRVQAVGYCLGGYYALLLGSAKHHLVEAVVGCHVSMVNKTHFEQIQVPIAIACAQEDGQFSDALRQEVEQILSRKPEVPSKFLLTEGTVHGFAARPNPDNPIIMKAYHQANDLIAEWATAHL